MSKRDIIKTVVITLAIIIICVLTLCITNGTFAQKNIISDYRNVITSNGEYYCTLLINDNWITTNEVCSIFVK